MVYWRWWLAVDGSAQLAHLLQPPDKLWLRATRPGNLDVLKTMFRTFAGTNSGEGTSDLCERHESGPAFGLFGGCRLEREDDGRFIDCTEWRKNRTN